MKKFYSVKENFSLSCVLGNFGKESSENVKFFKESIISQSLRNTDLNTTMFFVLSNIHKLRFL